MDDRTADDDVLDFLDKSGRKAKPAELGAWSGFGQQFKGLLRPSASAGRTLGVAAGGLGVLFDKAAAAGERLGMSEEDRRFREDLGLGADGKGLGAAEWVFENVVDGVGQEAVDYWTPDAATSGSAAQTAGTVFQVIGSVPQMFGAPALFLSDAAVAPATDTVMAGGSTEAALGVGGISLAANALGMKIPAAWGNSLATRLATGAGSNLAIGAAQDAATAGVLRADGVDDLADAYDPLNPQGRVLDTLMGAAFGVKAHVDAGYAKQAGDARRADLKQRAVDGIQADRAAVTRSQRDAILTANNANHFQAETMPGTPRDAAAAMQHQAAMDLATAQIAAGQRVDVAGKVDLDGFDLRDGLRTPADNGRWHARTDTARAIQSAADELGIDAVDLATVISYETGGTFGPDKLGPKTRISAANAETGGRHFGLIQFGAAEAQQFGANPRQTVAEQMPAVVAYLKARGVKPGASILEVYAAINGGHVSKTEASDAHNGGAPGTVRDKVRDQMGDHRKKAAAMFKDEGDRVSARDTNQAGADLRARLFDSADNLFGEYAKLPDSKGGRVLNTDTARELSPEYLADRTRSADVHEAASDTVKAIYADLLEQPTPKGMDPVVRFTAGGTGAGKTSGLKAMSELTQPEITYDTNMNKLSSSVEKIEQALSAGRDVEVVYVYRNPEEALRGGALPRAERQIAEFGTGRTVPIAEHAKTHTGARPVMEALAERYADNPRFRMVAIDNSRGKGNQAVVPSLDHLPKVDENGLHERLQAALDDELQAGRISEATHRGFSGRASVQRIQETAEGGAGAPAGRVLRGGSAEGDGGQVSPEAGRDVATAQEASRANPDMTVVDEDGNVVLASEYLAAAESEAALAADTARAMDAAASCFLRTSA